MHVSEQTQTDRQHIFIVNDSAEYLEVIRELLQDERYNVTTTNVVPLTFDAISALAPSLLMIDLVNGRPGAWDLLERLGSEATTHGIPIIVTSTSPRILERVQADTARFGCRRFLRKPFDLDDLLDMITDAIGPA